MLLNIPNKVLTDASLASSAKIIYGFFLYSKDATNQSMCKLTSQQIADIVGLERTAIPRLVQILENKGLVKIHKTLSVKNRLQYAYEVVDSL